MKHIAMFILSLVGLLGVLMHPEQAQSQESDPASIFGERKLRVANTMYPAETDGFLIAFSQGSGGASFSLLTGKNKDDLTRLSRGQSFMGAMIPVKNGHWYQIRFDRNQGGNPNNIRAYWIPFASPPQPTTP